MREPDPLLFAKSGVLGVPCKSHQGLILAVRGWDGGIWTHASLHISIHVGHGHVPFDYDNSIPGHPAKKPDGAFRRSRACSASGRAESGCCDLAGRQRRLGIRFLARSQETLATPSSHEHQKALVAGLRRGAAPHAIKGSGVDVCREVAQDQCRIGIRPTLHIVRV